MAPVTDYSDQRDASGVGLASLLVAALVVAALWAYWPGLQGGFLFDDHINLDALGRYGAIDSAPAFWRYITSGTADPFGRPVSLLSFLMDARNWPAPPGPFLRTNLAIHVLNGLLLATLSTGLERHLGTSLRKARIIGSLAAGFWLLHPYFVSTTLYVVQREAMLPGTLALAGLMTYGRALERERTGKASPREYYVGLACIALATLFAALAKANGLLTIVFAWVLSVTAWSGSMGLLEPRKRAAHNLIIVIPSLLLILAVCGFAADLGETPPGRQWTVAERLLAEGRILLEYLQSLANPLSHARGVFADGYPIATGHRDWIASAASWACVAAAVGLSVACRRRAPRLSTAVLFFFAGHLIESTVVPLEPYFEHRNYVPALLLFWPVAAALVLAPASRVLRAGLASGVLALLLLTTHQRAATWGNPAALAASWAATQSASSRAQANWSNLLVDSGHAPNAVRWLQPKWRVRPLDLQIAASLLDASCAARAPTTDIVDGVRRALASTASDHELAFEWLAYRLGESGRGACPGVSVGDLAGWVSALAGNPTLRDPAWNPRLASLRARVALLESRSAQARMLFDQAYLQSGAPDLLLTQASILRWSGQQGDALGHLALFDPQRPDPRPHAWGMPWVHARILNHQRYWQGEVEQLRTAILDDQKGRER